MHEQAEDDSVTRSQSHDEPVKPTPIPKFQLFIILLIQFAEPITGEWMISLFVRETGITGRDETKTGFYAGMLASPLQFSSFPVFTDVQESSFFLAECLTVYQLGRLSDIYGRRPVLLFGPLGLGLAMLGFGLCHILLDASRCAQGAFNGNLGVAKTVMNEGRAASFVILQLLTDTYQISDPSNVADIFSYLQLMWSLGSTASPFMGGVLANAAVKWPDTLGKIVLLRTHPIFSPLRGAASGRFHILRIRVLGLRERKDATPTPALADESESGVEDCSSAARTPHTLSLALMYSTPIALGGLGLERFSGGASSATFGARRISMNGFCALALVFTMYPVLSLLARRAGRVDKWVVAGVVCQLSCSFAMYFSYGASMLFIMDSAPNRASVGSMTGLSQMAGTVFRSVAPVSPLPFSPPSPSSFLLPIFLPLLSEINFQLNWNLLFIQSIVSSLFALSVKHNVAGGYLVYIGLVGLTGCALPLRDAASGAG
ncbi:hypothetical protein B0H14DRAFT_3464890 [Mycena olivaceomarginata]|nr:hypothetical protein B0H14DRAFT_3464890 [Mycena olivaceomarginata]